jgi:hypothetical protein
MDDNVNERIRELAEKASLYAMSQLTHEKSIRWQEIFETKFAELIIQECISTLEEKIYRSIDGDGDEIWVDLILKEHFGVEECK